MGNLQTKEQYNAQVRIAVDRIWEKAVSATDEGRIGLQDLYCTILLVYNELNKRLPGPWNEPPSKKEVESMFQQFDKDNDGKLDRDEVAAFLQGFTKKESTRITTNILLFSFLIPLLVDATRQITEQIPKVGGVVHSPTGDLLICGHICNSSARYSISWINALGLVRPECNSPH